MSNSPLISRRAALTGAAALPLAAATAGATRAAAPLKGVQMAPYQRLKVGNFDVTTLLAGTVTRENPHSIFGLNVDKETFDSAAKAANLPTDVAQFFFTPTVVNTGSELVLFDTGLNGAATTAALEAAGYTADQVDVVVLTHMHGDHIGGLMGEDGAPTYKNARYVTGQVEYDAWAKMDDEGFKTKVQPLAEKMSFLGDGGSAVAGITAMAAFGHTPGHMVYMLDSGGKQLLIAADMTNHYVWSLAYPDWEVRFDADKAAAAETRRKVLGMLAADRVPMIGYHMPFPGMGYVETRGDGFHYVPASYQMML